MPARVRPGSRCETAKRRWPWAAWSSSWKPAERRAIRRIAPSTPGRNSSQGDEQRDLEDALGSGLLYEQALLLEAHGLHDEDRATPKGRPNGSKKHAEILLELGASPDVECVEQTIRALRPRASRTRG
jgi:hypothetical protein